MNEMGMYHPSDADVLESTRHLVETVEASLHHFMDHPACDAVTITYGTVQVRISRTDEEEASDE